MQKHPILTTLNSHHATTSAMRLIVEMVLLYGGLPLCLWLLADNMRQAIGGRSFIILILPILCTVILIYLCTTKQFSWKEFQFLGAYKQQLKHILLLYTGFVAISALLVGVLLPELLFDMPKQRPLLLLLIWVFYPLLSVIPQTIIFRVFFVKRYDSLFANEWLMIIIGALCFGFGHILFNNWFAPIATFLGGLLFLWRYCCSGSVLLCALEHTMYGNWLFTVGLGRFIFAGQMS